MDKSISTLMQEIQAATDWSQPRIAEEIGTSQPTVNRILNGHQTDCKGSTMLAIRALHKRVCRKRKEGN
jgi:transcriptional regulator with XRE-family HTH domain